MSADLHVPQFTTHDPSRPNSPDVQSAEVALPEGMTLDPSAAHDLAACSNEQFGAGACPSASQIGTVGVDAPGIPDGSLNGGVFVGSPEPGQGPESGREYRILLIAQAPQYGVGLHLEGRVRADAQTGRLTASFSGAPQVPVEELQLDFNGRPRAPLANPLACGAVAPSAAIAPYGSAPTATAATSGFVVDGDGSGGACAAPLPFSLAQSIAPQSPAQAGAYSPFTFDLARGGGQQYPSHITTTLPPGLLGAIPSVALCPEPDASTGRCSPTSQIGTVSVAAGAGSEPYAFTGSAYLTGPYGGAPYGLSIVVPALAGPYDLGEVVTRAGHRRRPLQRKGQRDGHAADGRRRRPASTEEPERRGRPARLRVQPDQLRAAGERIDADLHARRRPKPQQPVPGRRLQRARVQAQPRRHHRRQAHESPRREHRSQDRPGRPPGQPARGAAAAAGAAALAPDHAAESVPGGELRKWATPGVLRERRARRRRDGHARRCYPGRWPVPPT